MQRLWATRWFYGDLARQNSAAHLFQLSQRFRLRRRRVSASSHMGFGLIEASEGQLHRTLHGLLSDQRSSTVSTCLSVCPLTCLSVCLRPVCRFIIILSVYHFSVDRIGWPIHLPALLFPASPSLFVDSLRDWVRGGVPGEWLKG